MRDAEPALVATGPEPKHYRRVLCLFLILFQNQAFLKTVKIFQSRKKQVDDSVLGSVCRVPGQIGHEVLRRDSACLQVGCIGARPELLDNSNKDCTTQSACGHVWRVCLRSSRANPSRTPTSTGVRRACVNGRLHKRVRCAPRTIARVQIVDPQVRRRLWI